ncbi:hypothetical protein RRG08_017068 [Elysia crispata]|uniref:Uncharacterized protein n=1 Tax=Elysia crispata TaxID=231223 RepID=A0AAE1DMF9_9GAST|nr:hypothetical protein RRG08_017068 [Elysia crispata]
MGSAKSCPSFLHWNRFHFLSTNVQNGERTSSTGQRPCQRSLKLDCQAKIRLKIQMPKDQSPPFFTSRAWPHPRTHRYFQRKIILISSNDNMII